MTKENNGKAARRRAVKRLAFCAVTVLVLTVLFVCIFQRADNNNGGQQRIGIPMNGQMPRRLGLAGHQHSHRHHSSHIHHSGNAPEAFDETGMDPHDVAVRFRQELFEQLETKDEIALLKDVLEAKLNLVEIVGIEEEVVRSPKNSYNGVYGRFCRLNFAVHKENPSNGESTNL